jgi:hypothetical protein
MLRSLIALALTVSLLSLGGCNNSPEYPFTDDFNGGFSSAWTEENEGLNVEELNGELHIYGTTTRGQSIRSGVKTGEKFPAGDFSASVDFRVPQFAGNGKPFVYLIAHAGTREIGVVYSPRSDEGYKVQVWNNQGLEGHKWSSAHVFGTNEFHVNGIKTPPEMPEWAVPFGNEKTAMHRLRLDYDSKAETVTGYVDNELIGSLNCPLYGPVGFELGAWTNESGMTVDLYCDNFSVVSPSSATVPSSTIQRPRHSNAADSATEPTSTQERGDVAPIVPEGKATSDAAATGE